MKTIYAAEALLAQGWARDVHIAVDDAGNISSVETGRRKGDAEDAGGPVLPGMANVHSHAFQRALAGLAERMSSPEDSFWTWRDVMYGFQKKLSPEQAQVIAEQVYMEMLQHGYTAVAEFHYVHNTPDGKPYETRAAMGLAHLRAAERVGIAITLLPSLYAYGNFGEEAMAPAQKRFGISTDALLKMTVELRAAAHDEPDVRIGVSPHSLRAVSPPMLKDLLAGLDSIDPAAPIHIHVAEQVKEVNDCLSWSNQRPAEWLLNNAPIDRRWCLVHCTHVTSTEVERLAASGAVVGLCPTSEGNLGDGIFPFMRFRDKGGRYAVGGDSHLSRDPAEELRWVEYGQRLTLRRRNVAASAAQPSVGTNLWREAALNGAQALGRKMGSIAPGLRADLVVLDADCVDLVGRSADRIADTLLVCAGARLVRHVMVAGRWMVRDRRHADEASITARYRDIARMLGAR
jgi:formimidoylglutamate deiminase